MKAFTFLILSMVTWFLVVGQDAPQADFYQQQSLLKQNAVQQLASDRVFTGQNYDLHYHRLEWKIDPDTLLIEGRVSSAFTLLSASDQLAFELYHTYTVDGVWWNGQSLNYSLLDQDLLQVQLPEVWAAGRMDSLTIQYHGVPPQGENFRGFMKDEHEGVPIVWTLSEPFGAKEWWPCKNDLSDKIDSVDVWVECPQAYRVASNGCLQSETVQAGMRITHWQHRYPIPAYLIAVAVTNYVQFSDYVQGAGDSLEILNYVYPENLSYAQEKLERTVSVMELYNNLFTVYPFWNEKYGHADFERGGGMEHTTMTFITGYSHELVSHELAHSWFGNQITCANWHDIWLNEGFATYLTGLTYEHMFEQKWWPLWKQISVERILKEPDGSVYVRDTTSVSRIFDARLSYRKGSYLLHMLRWVMGDEDFYSAIRNYLTDPALAYAYATTDDLIWHLEMASGMDLTEFFADWFYGEGYPVYHLQQTSNEKGQLGLMLEQTTSHPSVEFFEMPVPVMCKGEGRDTTFVLDHLFSGQAFTLDVGFVVDSVIVDPAQWLIAKTDTLAMGFDNPDALAGLLIGPNPAKDQILITNGSTSPIDWMQLIAADGRRIHINQQPLGRGEQRWMELSGVTPGIYFLEVISKQNRRRYKLVKS